MVAGVFARFKDSSFLRGGNPEALNYHGGRTHFSIFRDGFQLSHENNRRATGNPARRGTVLLLFSSLVEARSAMAVRRSDYGSNFVLFPLGGAINDQADIHFCNHY
jgi:hypothetical protein